MAIARDSRAGRSILGILVWCGLAFGAYSAYCFVPAWVKGNQVEGAVENILDHLPFDSADGTLRDRSWKASRSAGVEVEQSSILIRREKRPGERTTHVEFSFPLRVRFLGKTRELVHQVDARKTYAVDEAALAQREADEERRLAREKREQERSAARYAHYQARVKHECSRGDGQNVYTTHVEVTFEDGSKQMIPCSAVDSW